MKKTNNNTDLKGCNLTSDTDTDTAVVLNSLHTLDDYPLLASIASQIAKATKLNGRACRHIYMTAAPQNVTWNEVSPRELQFMIVLGAGLD